ncbi:MAG: ATP phosphoribosyltransferase regulatory subunit [Thaumarchaeota archaeon]|nr:ATP phosphoribosyltransferase regulatory subunit [Nitrososphaerota archaeon]
MSTSNPGAADLQRRQVVKETLTSIFRHHGAVEAPRHSLYPRSTHYGNNAVQLLDSNGTLVQLPYDLMLGSARALAKSTGPAVVQRSYCFGNVFRDKHDGGQPQMFGEVDFEVVTADTLDLALKEAEVIKVLDEIVWAFPALPAGQMCFHLGHSNLLQVVFDHCRVELGSRRAAAEILTKLNLRNLTWQKMRMELRSIVSPTSLDELSRFDFRGKQNTKQKSLCWT